MIACNRGSCGGTVGKTGYCSRCGKQPLDATEPPMSVRTSKTKVTRPLQIAGHGTGDGTVPLPVVDLPTVAAGVQAEPHVPEEQRFCGRDSCRAPVGRARGHEPARPEGFCYNCRTPYSFVPQLAANDVVDRRYEVVGCLARGGLGFVYLARDRRLGGLVALKGVINVNDTAAVRIAREESQILTALDHPNIVRILDVLTHAEGGDARYIVMEFVDGPSLREVQHRSDLGRSERDGLLLVEHVVAYGREILTALDYLHAQNLLYCDMKPDNVIHGEKRIKLIDFGAIRKINDLAPQTVGTHRYEIGEAEKVDHGFTERSDIHAVGVTLNDLFEVSDGAGMDTGTDDFGFGVDSFRRVLDRAVAPFAARFATAQEMLVQLDGVLTELLSLRDGKSRPGISTLFSEPSTLLDAGLGHPPPLEYWTASVPAALKAKPTARNVAIGLPTPREDPEDIQVAFLRAVRAPDAARTLTKLERVDNSVEHEERSVELELRKCRLLLELRKVDKAKQAVRDSTDILGDRAPHDWRVHWHRGLIALAQNQVAEATSHFDTVYRDIPGEQTPKLALGLCHELNDADDAHRYFLALWTQDNSQVNAAFGLARVYLFGNQPDEAVGILRQVPEVSRHYEAAQIAMVRILAEKASAASLRDADELMSGLDIDEDTHDRLVASVNETKLDAFRKGTNGMADESTLRDDVAAAYRKLARRASTIRDHDVLIDLANEVRPLTIF